MKILTIAGMVCLIAFSGGCDLFKCKDSEQPEINFEFVVWGSVQIRDYKTKENITLDWENREIKSPVWKCYCSGKKNGPFTSWYKISASGMLNYEGIGTWSFKMDNDLDYMLVTFKYEEEFIGSLKVYYSDLAQYNNGVANLEVRIEIEWDAQNNKIVFSDVELL